MQRPVSSVRDWISLIRPANSIMVGFAVVVGIAVVSRQFSQTLLIKALLGFLTGFLISSFSMLTNDIYDLEVDKINQPSRPIASGRIKLVDAKRMAFPFLILGLAASVLTGLTTFLIAMIFAIIGWYYNYYGKKLGLFGNALVASSLAIPYIYGSFELGNYSINLAYLLALTSFLAGLGREVLKGISDMQGDKIRHIRTVALSYGKNIAKQVAAAFFFLAVISSSFPVLANQLGPNPFVYMGLILIPDAIFLYLAARTLALKSDSESLKLKSIALLGMLLGLLAYLIAGIFS
jgi:geranylgeranylglycerol-phosphate geranylgeranyltransferase